MFNSSSNDILIDFNKLRVPEFIRQYAFVPCFLRHRVTCNDMQIILRSPYDTIILNQYILSKKQIEKFYLYVFLEETKLLLWNPHGCVLLFCPPVCFTAYFQFCKVVVNVRAWPLSFLGRGNQPPSALGSFSLIGYGYQWHLVHWCTQWPRVLHLN